MSAPTIPEVREVMRKIASGERKHGDFLTAFADAFIRADYTNEIILLPAALQLIAKYDLESYAAAPPDETLGELLDSTHARRKAAGS